jgi:hypothetical protein
MLFSTLPHSLTKYVESIKHADMFKPENYSKFENAMDFITKSAKNLEINPRRPYAQNPGRIKLISICCKLDQISDLVTGNFTHIFIDNDDLYYKFLTKLKLNMRMDLVRDFNATFLRWKPKQYVSHRDIALFAQALHNQAELDEFKKLFSPSRYTFIIHIPQPDGIAKGYIPGSYVVTIDTINTSPNNPDGVAYAKEVYGSRYNAEVPFNTVFVSALKSSIHNVDHALVHVLEDDALDNILEIFFPMNTVTLESLNAAKYDPLAEKQDIVDRLRASINIILYKMAFKKSIHHYIPPMAKFNIVDKSASVERLETDERIVKSSESDKAMHFRSGHFRTFHSDFYVNVQGETIWVDATIVNRRGDVETIDVFQNYS